MTTPFSFVRPDWFDDAACRGLDPAIFYPENGESSEDASAICGVCPVRQQCGTHALTEREKLGIWGDLSERGRRSYLRRAVKQIPHGTIGGVTAHRRRDIPLCGPCRVAEAEGRGARKQAS